MHEAGESKETGAVTGAFAPEIPNHPLRGKLQIPSLQKKPNLQISNRSCRAHSFFGVWCLRFPWDLELGIWDFAA
jgi:hypothetical protein